MTFLHSQYILTTLQGESMSDYNRTFNGDAKIKLTQLINEGMSTLHEIDTLNGGLNDTINAIAE